MLSPSTPMSRCTVSYPEIDIVMRRYSMFMRRLLCVMLSLFVPQEDEEGLSDLFKARLGFQGLDEIGQVRLVVSSHH